MEQDPMSKRFEKRKKQHELEEFANRTRPKDEVEAEKEMIKKTEKVPPVHADATPGRNDPCPCGSGKKYKKCCGAAAK
jgi:uncharacterized protein YecA (UPF0149 family)